MTTQLSTLLKPLENDTEILTSLYKKLGPINIDAPEAYEIVRHELNAYLRLPIAYYPNQYLLFKFENIRNEANRCQERIYNVLTAMAKEKPLASDSCTICIESLDLEKEKSELMYVTEGHVFHTNCLCEWVQAKERSLDLPLNPGSNVPLHAMDVEAVSKISSDTRATFNMGAIISSALYFTAVSAVVGLIALILLVAGSLIAGLITVALLANPKKDSNPQSRHITNSLFRVSDTNVSTSRILRATLLLSFSCVCLAMFLTGAANIMATGVKKTGLLDETVPNALTACNLTASIALGAALLFTTFVRDCLKYRDNKRAQGERQPLLPGRVN